MLAPKRVKFRKRFKGRTAGLATRGNTVAFGHYGLMTLEPGWITNRQLEAARVALTREMKRGGKVWIRLVPDKPITKKPAETRMGKGKGNPEGWVAVVKPGRGVFQVEGIAEDLARAARQRAGAQVATKPAVVDREERRGGAPAGPPVRAWVLRQAGGPDQAGRGPQRQGCEARRHRADRGDATALQDEAVARGRSRRARALRAGGGTVVQQETILKIADNSGARSARVIRALGASKRRYGGVGGIVVVTIKDALPPGQIKKGGGGKAGIVRTAKGTGGEDGSYIRFA